MMSQTTTSEIAGQADFSIIRYALCWEDADILLDALEVGPEDVCLSIASAGDNTLSLLSRAPRRVIAVDLSPAQMACLDLRVAAFRHLPYAEILALFGSVGGRDCRPLYDRIRPELSLATREVWDRHRDCLTDGAAAAGRFEHYIGLFRRFVLPLIHNRRTVRAAFSPRSNDQRREFYDTIWNTTRWRLLGRLFTSQTVSGWLGRDPSFFRYAEGDVAGRTLKRAEVALVDLDPSTNPYLHWIAFGCYGAVLPHWLRPENFQAIRHHLDRLELHVTGLETWLSEAADASIDKFNLSDVFEYVSSENAALCFESIARVGRPGGRLAYWNTFVPRRRPESLAHRIRPLDDIASRLHARDKAFFYSAFVVEEIA